MSHKPTTPKTPIASSTPVAKPTIHHSVFDALPDSAFIREAQLVQSPKRPTTPAPLPFSAPTLWRLVKLGTFPKPTKLSARVTAWQVCEVRVWMAAQAIEQTMTTNTTQKAAILAAPTKLIDTADVFIVQSLTTKKRIKSAMGGTAK